MPTAPAPPSTPPPSRRSYRGTIPCLAAVAAFAVAVVACNVGNGDAPLSEPTPASPDGTDPAPGQTEPGEIEPGDDARAPSPKDKDAGKDAPAPEPACTAPAGGGDILGTVASGACCVLRARLKGSVPTLDTNVLAFSAGETYARTSLSPGGQILFDEPNAGGSSIESEVMSFEVLRYCEGATLLKTETQITYQPPDGTGANSITDYLVSIEGRKIGVSVTRAYKPPSQTLTDADIKLLIEKKLEAVNRSSLRVLPADKWDKQILHVLAVDKPAADAVARVWAALPATLRADTAVLVTQTTGGGFVYCNPDPALGSECQ